jgi:hypothetical protein
MTSFELIEKIKEVLYAEHNSLRALVKISKLIAAWEAQAESEEQGMREDDAISRQAAIEKIHWLGLDSDTAIKCDFAIRALPSVNSQEQKTGHWIECPEIKTSAPEYLMFYKCSECGDKQCDCEATETRSWVKQFFHYCPNCGAKMESEDKE